MKWKDGTHSYAGATACREARRRRVEGSSSERSRSQLRPRCPSRSRYPALPVLLLLLLRPPWLTPAQVRLSRIFSRGFNRSRRSYRDLPPRLATLPPLTPSLPIFPSRFLSFSPSSCRQFDRTVSRAQTDPPGHTTDSLLLFLRFFLLFSYRSPGERENSNSASQAECDRLSANSRRDFGNERRVRARLPRGVKCVADGTKSRYRGKDRCADSIAADRQPRPAGETNESETTVRVPTVGPGNAGAARHPSALRIATSRTLFLFALAVRACGRARVMSRVKGPTHCTTLSL